MSIYSYFALVVIICSTGQVKSLDCSSYLLSGFIAVLIHCIGKVYFTQALFWPRTFLSMLYFYFGFLEMYHLGSEFVLLVREMKMKTLFTNCIPLLLTFLLLHSRVSLSLFYSTLHWNYGHLVNMTTSVADQNEAGRAEKMFLRPPSLPSPLYLRF